VSERRAPLLVAAQSGPGYERGGELFAGRDDAVLLEARPLREQVRAVLRARPRVLYLVDIGSRTVVLALLGSLLGAAVVVDTGDLVYELERSKGARSRLGLGVVWVGERLALALASHVVVRGVAHLDLAGRPATYAPDLAPAGARPEPGDGIRARLGLDHAFVVGLVGSLNPAPRLGVSYGWDLVEALARTAEPVSALVVGDGAARPSLEARARELGVAERCRFAGRIPPSEVAEWIGAMDAAISTQSNDAVGAVRTTGKLPLYLACGCPVLASHVGEAARLLGPLGWTIPYEGTVDRSYPERLAQAVDRWAADPAGAPARREQALRIYQEAFDPEPVRARVWGVVDELMARSAR
jgi:glycosyltransferase involved in cell wall biosynthesis